MTKDSFIMYKSWAEMMAEMPPEELAVLSRAIACYQLGRDFSIDNPMVSAVFDMIRGQFDRDDEKYEETCRKRTDAIRQRWDTKEEKQIQENTNEYKSIQNGSESVSDSDNDNEYIKEKTSKEVKEKAPKRFSAPSLEEVREYCLERGNNVDPERFCDFYDSVGWKVGNKPMKDWKAAVRTWERREEPKARSGTTNNFKNFEERKTNLDLLEEQYFRKKYANAKV